MNYAAGFISGAVCGFWTGIASAIILYLVSWAAWFYRDRLIWRKVRAAEQAAPIDHAVIIDHHFGARL